MSPKVEIIKEAYPQDISKKLLKYRTVIPNNLMKNNSFKIDSKKNFINEKIDLPNQGHKRAKSNIIIFHNSDKNLDELQVIEPDINYKKKNSISKIISFKNNESNKINNNINKKIKLKSKKVIIHNLDNQLKNKKNYATLNGISHNDSFKKKKKCNSIISNEFLTLNDCKTAHRKNNSSISPTINNNIFRKKIQSHKKPNKYNSNNIPNTIINNEKIPYKKTPKFKINKKYINDSISKKEKSNKINMSHSSRQNSFSTDINSSSAFGYSPNITFGSKQNSKKNHINHIKKGGVPKKFIYVKKVNQNQQISKFKKKLSIKNDINNVIIDDIYENNNNKINHNVNYNIEEKDKIDEDIQKISRISYIEKFKTFEEIEKKNINMNIINNCFNIKSNKNNENYYLYDVNEEQYYKDLKTATFAFSDNEK